MLRGSRFDFLRSRTTWIALGAALAVSVVAFGLYLNFRPQPQSATASAESLTPLASAAPSVRPVGVKTVSKSATVDVLTVVATSPSSRTNGAAANTAINLSFNLPVDPARAESYFSVLPEVSGTFSQGATSRDIVFTPSGTFGFGSSVNVVLRKGYSSRDGYALQDDYSFSFITAVSARNVLFQVGNQVARVHNAQSGRPVTVTVQFGDGVPSSVTLETFRATAGDLLAAQVHDGAGAYLDQPIATGAMQSVARVDVANGGSYTVTQPDGIYLLLAADGETQYGAMWLDFSRFGVILRQDDQKIVVAGEDLTTGATTPTFDVTFFNLQDGVQEVLTGTFTGTAEYPLAYPATIDLAVASSGGEDVVIPIVAPQTNADIKVVGDLSQQLHAFVTTDRAGYQEGDTVKFAGAVRISNDQAYSVPAGITVAVWSGYGPSKLVNQPAPVAEDGTFSGSFEMPAAAFDPDGADAQMTLYVGTVDQAATDFSPFFTTVAALGNHAPQATIAVTFDASMYVASDSIVASVSGVDSGSKPLAGESVKITVYSTGHASQPSELDSFPGPNTWGLPVQESVSVPLDTNGRATYTFKANLAEKAADQEVTLTATYGSGAAAALGARTAIVYQAGGEVFLLPSRTVYEPGDTVIAPFVVETRTGQRGAGLPVAYEIDRTEYEGSTVTTTVIASGTVPTDANGLGTVHTTYSGPVGGVVLRVKGKDAAGNVFEDARWMTITDDPASLSSFGTTDILMQLSVITDKIAYASGDEAHVTVTSPSAINVLMSLDRGRIHLYKWVSLERGDNPLTLTISPDLAPGFTLAFSYFRDGAYFSEGLPIRVNNSDRLLNVTIAPDQTSYAAGQTARVTITVTDSTGSPVAATLLVDGYYASMSAYKLVDKRSIAGAFFSPAARGTNSSSSLVGIGNWGGRCGISGDGGNEQAVTNSGHVAVWLTGITTDSDGKATIDVPIGQESLRLVVFAATSTTLLGQAQMDISVQ